MARNKALGNGNLNGLRKKRGSHSKKTSSTKTSQNYKKPYRGQGR